MSSLQAYPKPIIAVGCVFISSSFILLKYPKYSVAFIAAGFLIAAVTALILLLKRRRLLAAVFFFTFILSVIIPYVSYIKTELAAKSFVVSLSDESHGFTGTVLSYSSSGSYVSFTVSLQTRDGEKLEKPFKAQLYAYTGDYAAVGDTIGFEGKAVFTDDAEQSDFDSRSYFRSKSVFIQFKNAKIVSSHKAQSVSPLNALRDRINQILYEYLPEKYDYTTAAAAKALVLGDRGDLSKQVKNNFKRSGLTHMLCVSGMHLTVLAGFAARMLRAATVHKKLRAAILCGLCVFYILLTGASASVVRAGIMSICAYTALIFGRKSDCAASLFLAGAVMCAVNPYTVLDVGAQLSFLSTLGIIVCSGNLEAAEGAGFVNNVLNAAAANIGAVCFSLPLSASVFGGISLAAFVSTFFASLPCEMALILLMLLILFASVHFLEPVCVGFAWLCNYFINLVLKTAKHFSEIKYAYVPFSFPEKAVFAFLILALLLVFMSAGKPGAVKLLTVGILIICAVTCVVSLVNAVIDDEKCKVSYYRKSASDRQLSVKLGSEGALIVNADSVLCTNADKAYFDVFSGYNYILLLPSEYIDKAVLAQNIKSFDNRFGVKHVLIPDCSEGEILRAELENGGVCAELFSKPLKFGNITVSAEVFGSDDAYVCINDGASEVFCVLSDKYSADDFDGHTDICAFFTRETKNQFLENQDLSPPCRKFYTRLKRDSVSDGIQNIYGKTSVILKE